MDRSLAGRLGGGSLTRQPARARPRKPAARAPKRGRGTAHRRANAFDAALGRLASLLAGAARLARDCWAYAWRRRRLRIALIVALIASPLLAGGWMWLRNSSLVAVHHVRVTGAHGAQARAIDAALSSAARRMTTLDVHAAALRSAVASYPVVRDLKISTSFPHGLGIQVIEQPAVAALMVSGTKTAVAANGIALGPVLASGSLPVVSGFSLPAPGQRLRDTSLLGVLAVLGAAPSPLARQVKRAYSSSKGLTLVMHSGLVAYFGDASRPHAKWLSLARVLADSSSAGASYVDVRLPERPAAGFADGVAPALSASEAEVSGSASSAGESPQALAEGLAAAVGGGSSAGASAGSTSTSGEAEAQAKAETESPASSGEESTSPATSESGG